MVVCYPARANWYTDPSWGWSQEAGRYDSKRKACFHHWLNVGRKRNAMKRPNAKLPIFCLLLSVRGWKGEKRPADFRKAENIRTQWPSSLAIAWRSWSSRTPGSCSTALAEGGVWARDFGTWLLALPVFIRVWGGSRTYCMPQNLLHASRT